MEQKPEQKTQQTVQPKRAIAGFVLSLIAGILVLVEAIIALALGALGESPIITATRAIRRMILGGIGLTTIGIVGVIFAIVILIGAYLIYKPGNETAGGILVLVFSLLSIVAGGGFVIGFIIGIIGGGLGLARI